MREKSLSTGVRIIEFQIAFAMSFVTKGVLDAI
jgi:hypothetical protein